VVDFQDIPETEKKKGQQPRKQLRGQQKVCGGGDQPGGQLMSQASLSAIEVQEKGFLKQPP